jgi:molybdenum cofactor cytidylyltransferase/nicotine blue oxidoreductase
LDAVPSPKFAQWWRLPLDGLLEASQRWIEGRLGQYYSYDIFAVDFLFIITLMTLERNSSDLRLAIVLLAAGEGSRMGSIPKALLRKDGKTLIERFFTTIEVLHPVEVLVLTGFYAQAIESEIEGLNKTTGLSVATVRNPNPQNGQKFSVRLALESLKSKFDVLAMCLCDQPNIGVKEMKGLLSAFASLPLGKNILVPMVGGQRGNPVLFSKEAIDSILSEPDMVCRSFIDQNPSQVWVYRTEDLAFIQDVDTESDILKMGLTRY